MGLLDIWNDWKKENQGQTDGFQDYLPDEKGTVGTLDTAGGVQGSGVNAAMNRTGESPLIKKPMFNTQMFPPGQGQANIGSKTLNLPKQMLTPDAQAKQAQAQVNASNKTPMSMPSDPIVTGGSGVKEAQDMGFMQKLSNMAGVDFSKASEQWKDKGGFEGLMANPAFSLGLALMQSSANGKTINQGILDNFVKSAKISTEFKDRIEARKQEPIQATSQDVAEVKSLLDSMNVSDPSTLEKFFGKVTGKGNLQMKFDMAAEDIANELEKEMARLQKAVKPGQPPLVFDTTRKFKILERMLKSGKFKKKGGTWFTDATLESTTKIPFEGKAQGGPVQAGKPYVVGEEGPEIIIPTSDGNVLSNDDSQIYAMLLASNPQLQKVSRQRAEKILRNRFPEYFEG